jgi:hypothetical protein
MIVPGGGLSFDNTRWIASRSNFLMHVNVLARLFRGKMLAMFMAAHDAGQLKFFNTQAGLADKRTFKRFIGPLQHIKWVVYSRRRSPDQNRSCAICPVTRTVSPSRAVASWQPTTPASRSAGRTIAATPGPLEDDAAAPARVHQSRPRVACCQASVSFEQLDRSRIKWPGWADKPDFAW